MDATSVTKSASNKKRVTGYNPGFLGAEPIRKVDIFKGRFPEVRRDEQNAQAVLEVCIESLRKQVAILTLSDEGKTMVQIVIVVDPGGDMLGLRKPEIEFRWKKTTSRCDEAMEGPRDPRAFVMTRKTVGIIQQR